MNEQMERMCKTLNVNFRDLYNKVTSGLAGADIQHFTDEELMVIQTALVIAGE